jgi:two-component system OmpR family sensor kinase
VTLRRRAGSRTRWSLRRRLVASCVALVAVVCAVIGAVTILALHDFLYGQLDAKVRDLAVRASGPHGAPDLPGAGAAKDGAPRQDPRQDPGQGPLQGRPDGAGQVPLGFLIGGGQPRETVGAVVASDGAVEQAAVSATDSAGSATGSSAGSSSGSSAGSSSGSSAGSGNGALVAAPLDAAQSAAFAHVPRDGRPHTLDLPGLGGYRVQSARPASDGSTVLVGLSTKGTRDTLSTLMWVEVSVSAAGLAAAGLAGAALMRIALHPLRRVAATATRVSELPLDRGEVALHERVPDSDTDPRTEVGQVGAALNRMLGHVASALHARQESETRVRRFVADASHELRTPLASIRGYAELTRRGREPVGPDTRRALGRIESEASRMTTLVEDLLLLARLDAGRPLSPAPTDLAPLVVDAVSDARAAGGGHRWRLDLPDEPALVHGDPQRLHQVLTNLLANARTHTPPGTTVTARVRAAYGGPVRLEVEDDGPGIPADLQGVVFERFVRGDASRTRAPAPGGGTGGAGGTGSTGLGLAIVRSVVAAHGGDVALASAPGRTVFSVTLPPAGSQVVPSPGTPS